MQSGYILIRIHFNYANKCSIMLSMDGTVYIVDGKPARRYKRYVDVLARHTSLGGIIPYAVCWVDGRTYFIDEILNVDDPWPDCKGHWQVRYTIRLADHVTELHLEQAIRDKGSDEIAKERWWVMAVEYRDRLKTP